MIPANGRIVHYHSSTGETCCAALVTKVHDFVNAARLNLMVFYPDGGMAARLNVPVMVDGMPMAGRWHWPEKAEGGVITKSQVYLAGE